MPWIKLPGTEGLVYEPEASPHCRKRHKCPDCYSCQMCSETRCRVCRKRRASGRRSFAKPASATRDRASKVKRKK